MLLKINKLLVTSNIMFLFNIPFTVALQFCDSLFRVIYLMNRYKMYIDITNNLLSNILYICFLLNFGKLIWICIGLRIIFVNLSI